MLQGANAPIPPDLFSPEDLSLISRYMRPFNLIMQCKNLGITLSASEFDVKTVSYVHEMYNKVQEIQYKKKT